MKAHDTVAMNATRSIKGEILLFKTSEGGSKEFAGRQKLADNELAEAAVMEKYLPKQLSADEVKVKIQEMIAQVGASSINDIGKVMAALSRQ